VHLGQLLQLGLWLTPATDMCLGLPPTIAASTSVLNRVHSELPRSYNEQKMVEDYFLKHRNLPTYWIGLRQSYAPAGSGGHSCRPWGASSAALPCAPLAQCGAAGSSPALRSRARAPTAPRPQLPTAGTWSGTGFVWEDGTSTAPTELASSQANYNSDGYSHWVYSGGAAQPNGGECVYADRNTK
jgi:hypothetical protein